MAAANQRGAGLGPVNSPPVVSRARVETTSARATSRVAMKPMFSAVIGDGHAVVEERGAKGDAAAAQLHGQVPMGRTRASLRGRADLQPTIHGCRDGSVTMAAP
jgi:hypothetical protein